MKQTVNFYQFANAFETLRPNNFTREGLVALFEMLEEWEESTGTEIELDVIALCCEFTEYENIEEFNADYNTSYKDWDKVHEETVVYEFGEGSAIIMSY